MITHETEAPAFMHAPGTFNFSSTSKLHAVTDTIGHMLPSEHSPDYAFPVTSVYTSVVLQDQIKVRPLDYFRAN